MAGERFADLAIVSLAASIEANFATYARALETAQGLAAGTLADPVDVLEANNPNDLRSPLIEVFDSDGDCVNNRTNEWDISCTVALSFAGDSDIEANERTMRRYTTVMIDTLRHDVTLGGKVTALSLMDYSSDVLRGDSSATRYVFAFKVSINLRDNG